MFDFRNYTDGKVLGKSYNSLDETLMITIQIPKEAQVTNYFMDKLKAKYDLAILAPVGEADENNRGFISDYLNLNSEYLLGCKISEPLMIVLANAEWIEK